MQRGGGAFFEGWYFKHQLGVKTLALIPGFHRYADGNEHAFIQILTPEASYWVEYPAESFSVRTGRLDVKVGNNVFSEKGIHLDIATPAITCQGDLSYGLLSPIQGDIMGPFIHLPFLECSHGVVSMAHRLWGSVRLAGETIDFTGGSGYIEKDSGRSFPRSYLWAQANRFQDGKAAVMAAVADVPVCGVRIRGCICAVQHEGREYRLATYTGARAEACAPNQLCIRQKDMHVTIEAQARAAQPLRAPQSGAMRRTIHEDASCEARVVFSRGGTTVFDLHTPCASFEYVAPPQKKRGRVKDE